MYDSTCCVFLISAGFIALFLGGKGEYIFLLFGMFSVQQRLR